MTDKELTQEQSRSVQRRIAAQKGLPAPDFSRRLVVKKLYELVSDEVAQVIETFGLQDKVRMPRKWAELPETAKEYWQEKAKLWEGTVMEGGKKERDE